MDMFRPWYLKKLQMISFTTITDAVLLETFFPCSEGTVFAWAYYGIRHSCRVTGKVASFQQYGLFLGVGSFGSKVVEQFCSDFCH